MRQEILALLAVAVIVLIILARPIIRNVQQSWALQTRHIYVEYVDTFVIFFIAVVSIMLFITSLIAYRRERDPRLACITSAFFLFVVKTLLILADFIAGGPKFWFVDTISHLLDGGILLLFALALFTR